MCIFNCNIKVQKGNETWEVRDSRGNDGLVMLGDRVQVRRAGPSGEGLPFPPIHRCRDTHAHVYRQTPRNKDRKL